MAFNYKVQGSALVASTVPGTAIVDGAIDSDALATNAVQTADITNANVTADKLAATLDLSSKTVSVQAPSSGAHASTKTYVDTAVSGNATDIATNTSGISTNASAISTNSSNITTVTSSAATNASAISTNTSNISALSTSISTLQTGMEWQDSVADRGGSVPTGSDQGRFLKNSGGNEGIYEWDGSSAYARVTTLSEGMALWVDDDNVAIIYNGSAWVTMATASGSLQVANNLSDIGNAGTARTNLGVDAAGTDNSTNVTLASVSSNYLSLSGQAITAGTVPVSLGGTGATSAGAARTALGVDAAGTDNSTNVTVTGKDYVTLSGQALTMNSVDLTDDVTGTLPVANGGTGLTSLTTLLNSNVTTTTLGLQNVTNESKAVMFADPAFTGTATIEGMKLNRQAVANADFTVDSGSDEDTIIGVTTASGASTITLPAASGLAGRSIWIKDEGGNANNNAITVDGNASETIDGAATITLNVAYSGVMLYCDGSNWFIL
jgi:hypothetical protein